MDFGNHFDEPFQDRLVGIRKGTRTRRENFEQADDPEIGDDGSSHQRTYSQGATDSGGDSRIVFRIRAGDEEAAANALSRQPLGYVDGGSQRRSGFAGSRPADHLGVCDKRQCCATGFCKT